MPPTPMPSDAPARREPPVPLRALAVGDIVSGSFRTLMRSPRIFVGMPLIAFAAIATPALALALLAVGGARASGGSSSVVAIAALGGLILGLIAAYLLVRVVGAVTIGAYRTALGEGPTIAQVWREARGIVWRLVVYMLLISTTILIAFFLVTFAVFAAGNVDSNAAAILVLVLMVAGFPTVLFLGVKLVFALPAMAIEHAGPIAAIRRSWSLTRGVWWPTLGRLVMLYLLSIPVSVVVQGIIVVPMAGLIQSHGTLNMAGIGAMMMITLVIAVALNFLYQVFSQIYVTVMYLDARRRESVTVQPQASYPYAGAPAYQQQPPGVAYGSATGYGAASGYGAPGAAGGAPGIEPYPSTNWPSQAASPTSAGETVHPYPPAGPLWSHPPHSGGQLDPALPPPASPEPLPTFDFGSSFDAGSSSGSGSDGSSSSSSD